MRPCVLLLVAALLAAFADPPPEERVVPGGRSGWATDGAGGCWLWVGGLPGGASDIRASWSGPCPSGPAEGTGRSLITWRVGGQDRSMAYEGPLVHGKAEGRGKLNHYEGGELTVVEEGEYRNDHLVEGRLEIQRQGLTYEGRMRAGHPHGQGRLTLRGQVFEGEWENGCLPFRGAWVAFTRPAASCQGQDT
ncbi:hypothetical protein JYK14_16555 [Siccirubricoccus sp. KC 17139]|uniref:MORN repeat-containing protein n=1 Tax=Siccirubricoccus soli TaxID=2899147 RepID=A0ABT1D921_9PROT|nr:hypothetical protein [Siccirubricoccus soli]MCO6417760.1 hypothetical protein [Siccirubricoccus soli]MCP2683895.1 hypothetical protein [Siccirubricoccus soli]